MRFRVCLQPESAVNHEQIRDRGGAGARRRHLHRGVRLELAAGHRLEQRFLDLVTPPIVQFQFGVGEDFEAYPRDMERDQALAQETGVDVIFAPQASEMYPPGYQTSVNVEGVTQNLCGMSRPTHFRGVTTVVCKLFCIVQPNYAIFGEKDFQQLVAIRQMVSDLNFDLEIVGMPIYREEDGLAMSSRNRYLTPDERKAALCIINSLQRAKAQFDAGEREGEKIAGEVKNGIEAEPLSRIDYIKICDAGDLKDIDQVTQRAVLAVAVNVGKARLIDNVILDPLAAKEG